MTEWGVVGVIVVLVGLVGAIVGPMLKLNTTITILTVTMRQFEGNMGDLTSKNSKDHGRLRNELDEHGKKLGRHETRITVLEEQNK